MHCPRPAPLVSLLAVLALAGCSATATRGALDQVAQSVRAALPSSTTTGQPGPAPAKAAAGERGEIVTISGWRVRVGGPKPTDARWAGPRLSETPLRDVFANRPVVPGEERWPRVSIDVTDHSESLLLPLAQTAGWSETTPAGAARPDECVRFNAVLWNSERDARRFQGLVMCNSDIDPTQMRAFSVLGLRYYARQVSPMPSYSSGQARTAGPKVPMTTVPQDTAGDLALWSNGSYLFGSLFYAMRYRGPLMENDARVWFVNLSKDRY